MVIYAPGITPSHVFSRFCGIRTVALKETHQEIFFRFGRVHTWRQRAVFPGQPVIAEFMHHGPQIRTAGHIAIGLQVEDLCVVYPILLRAVHIIGSDTPFPNMLTD